MSVVNECLEGDIIYNIKEWWAVVDVINDKVIDRKIEIGEELIFLDSYIDIDNKMQPYAWQVKFRCKDGYVSNASQFNFVTEDEWKALVDYFHNYFIKKI